MQATVKWTGDQMHFVGTSASGHDVMMDCSGDGEAGPSPMELVLLSVGGCSTVDVVSILQKGRQQVTGCEVKVDGVRREEIPRVYTAINLHYVVSGQDLSDKLVARAVRLSMEKYCSVSTMLAASVEISHSYEIRPA